MSEPTVTPDAPTKTSTIIISSAVANERYPRVLGMKTPGGSPIRDCGDRVAVALRGTGMSDWLKIAAQNGILENLQALIDIGKNTGQVRMALGRMLRARLDKHNADPEKNPEPIIPEPRPMPVRVASTTVGAAVAAQLANPKPPEDDSEEDDDEVAEEEEESDDEEK